MDPLEYIVPDRKRIPYGMMNFADIRLDNYYYVDKTRFIPMIEQADRFFFFIRPRRFGKSLTLNLLQHYYDVRTRDKFDALFGDLYIGQHPTPDRRCISLSMSTTTSQMLFSLTPKACTVTPMRRTAKVTCAPSSTR